MLDTWQGSMHAVWPKCHGVIGQRRHHLSRHMRGYKCHLYSCCITSFYVRVAAFVPHYSLFTLRKPRSPLRINGERGFLRVNRLLHPHHAMQRRPHIVWRRKPSPTFIYILLPRTNLEILPPPPPTLPC